MVEVENRKRIILAKSSVAQGGTSWQEDTQLIRAGADPVLAAAPEFRGFQPPLFVYPQAFSSVGI